jgi:tagatose-6-phosphate ketose/aldose isomerase
LSDTRTAPLAVDDTATYAEIRQQPGAWRAAAADLAARRAEVDAFLAPLLAEPALRIVLTGAGTSAFVGEIAAPTLTRILGRRVDAVATTDIVADPRGSFGEQLPTLVVSFARSGNSPESVAATRLADQVLDRVRHVVITCDAEGALAKEHAGTDRALVLTTPPQTNDTGFAMTSSFSTMLLTCLLTFLGDRPEAVDRLAAAADEILAIEDRIDALLDAPTDRVVYLGSGAYEGLARESALKLLELTAGSVVSFFDSPLGFRHGPKAVFNDETLVIVYESGDPYTAQYDRDIVAELRAVAPDRVVRIGATPAGDDTDIALATLAPLEDGFRAVAQIVFAQLLALHASVRAGCTPDNPFPGGAVNRVVQGVTVHPLEP